MTTTSSMTPAQPLVRQTCGSRCHALCPRTRHRRAPLIRVRDPTSDPGAIRFQVLPDTFEPKLVKAAERGQVSFIRQKHRVRAHRVGVPSAYRYERSRRSR